MNTTEIPSIAFVNPSVGYGDRRKSKPIGLAYIMAYLRAHGLASTGFDFGDAGEDAVELAERYRLDRFSVLGFSIYNESFNNAVAMATWAKQRHPDVFIVVGGPHATAIHEHIARNYPCFDAIVRREGEQSMLELLTTLRDPDARRRVAGTTQPGGADAAPIVNPDRTLTPDLDVLPFPDAEFISHSGYPPSTFYDEVVGRQKPALTICSSRSCPYNCSFCGVLTIGRKYRSREAHRIVEELRHFRERDGVRYEHVYFSDANFFVSPKRALEVARALHATDPDLTFSFGTRANQVVRAAAVLPELKACGLRFVELGIESASPAVLERLAKQIHPDMNAAAVRLLRGLGIDILLDFIMLDPATTLDDIAANVDFLRQLGLFDYVPHDHLYTALVLYEGTPIRKYYEQRLGVTFDPAELPSPYGLFERPEVRVFCDEMQRFRRSLQVRIDRALATGELLAERAARSASVSRPALARLQLDVLSLRHAPNLFAESLLADARAGYPVLSTAGPAGLLPHLGHDHVSLDELLARVEQPTWTLSPEPGHREPEIEQPYERPR